MRGEGGGEVKTVPLPLKSSELCHSSVLLRPHQDNNSNDDSGFFKKKKPPQCKVKPRCRTKSQIYTFTFKRVRTRLRGKCGD